MFKATIACLLLALTFPICAKEAQQVQVADPYIDLRTGPGKGYPKFYVAEQGHWISLLKRKTSWFKVRLENGTEGWVSDKQLIKTLTPDGESLDVRKLDAESLGDSHWGLGISGGDFGGADLVSLHIAYIFTENISTELTLSQALGTFSNNHLYDISLQHRAFPEWKVSPYFTLGAGQIRTDPNATLVATEDRTDDTFHVGAGVEVPLARRFALRIEYRNYLALTSRDDDEEIEQWKIGLNAYF